MPIIRAALLAFASGFAIETACVYWTHFAERNRALPTSLFSVLIGTAQVIGFGESIHDWRLGVPFVIGYGVGTFTAVRRKGSSHVSKNRNRRPRPRGHGVRRRRRHRVDADGSR